MASFMDDEAEVGTTDDEDEMETENSKSMKKKKHRTISSDEEEDSDDEEKAAEEMQGFIADDDVEDEPVRHKKKKRREKRSRSKSRSEEEEDIDDDDRELLKENLGIDFAKKRKRIRMESGSDDSASEPEGQDQDAIPELDEQQDGYESDPNDFIVDAEGRPLRTERKKKKTHLFQDEERQMAEDIFGVKFDYGEFEQYGDDEEMEEDYEEDLELDADDPEAAERQRKRKNRKQKTIFEMFEPAELEKRHFTEQDNEIRNTDIPERMQLRNFPVCAPENDEELSQEADWIFSKFTTKNISQQETIGDREITAWLRNKDLVTEKIRNALEHIRTRNFEPPYISFYCKEYVQPELQINDLWRVYKMDEEWCKLLSRKKSLKRLFQQCKEFQEEKICQDLDAPMPEDIKLVKDDDIERIEAISTFEEAERHGGTFSFLLFTRSRTN